MQFAYPDLLRGEKPTWEHFYTSNLSGTTELLRADPFSQTLLATEWKLSNSGIALLEMHCIRDAVGEHIHPTDVVRSCHRMMTAG